MQEILIQGTKTTPFIKITQNGYFLIEGVSLPEDSLKFYQPLFDYARKLEVVEVVLDIKVEYLNTSSTKQMYILFKTLTENPLIKKVRANWYYAEDDEDMLDSGQYYKSLLPTIEFRFIEYADVL